MLFGSDWPVIPPDRWLRDFAKLDIKPEVRPLVLKENAIKLLGLGGPKPAPDVASWTQPLGSGIGRLEFNPVACQILGIRGRLAAAQGWSFAR